MPRSVLEAIKQGDWSFEPSADRPGGPNTQIATTALPGSVEKLDVLAERLLRGQPLWHPADRRSFNDEDRE